MKLPGRQVKYKPGMSVCRITTADKGRMVLARISTKNKDWIAIRDGCDVELDGHIGGYSWFAFDAAFALAELGIWSKRDAEKFKQWFVDTDHYNNLRDQLAEAIALLQENGYVVDKRR